MQAKTKKSRKAVGATASADTEEDDMIEVQEPCLYILYMCYVALPCLFV